MAPIQNKSFFQQLAPIQNKPSRKKKKTTCYLPEEIICNILFRIPAKNLAKFKCTSKSLFSIITKPYFRNHFLTQHTNYGEDILFSTCEKIEGVISTKYEMNHFSINEHTMNPTLLDYIYNQKDLILHSSCDGLILFTNHYDPNQLNLSNPVTNQLVSLPPSKYLGLVWTLVYDACVDIFSVHGISTDGKLMSFTQGEVDWKETSILKISNDKTVVHTDPILVNGELVWLTEDASEDEQDAAFFSKLYYICYFNVQTREFTSRHIPACYVTPSPQIDPDHCYFLSLIQGSLCLTIINPVEIVMFVLEDRVSNQWDKFFLISLSYLLFDKPKTFIESFLSEGTCSFAMRNTDINSTDVGVADVLNLMVHHEDQLYLCDLKNQQWKRLAGFLNKDKCLALKSIFHCYSLVDWERGRKITFNY